MGIATELEFDLVSVPNLWAGLLLWPVEHADDLLRRWAAMVPGIPQTVTSTIATLQLPPQGPFPDELRGRPVVHLSYASVDGEKPLTALREALGTVARPTVDTTGPADATRLAQIHLDPSVRVPARGIGQWLTADGARAVPQLFEAALVGQPDGMVMVELRHVATTAVARSGARSTVAGPFLLLGVGIGDRAHLSGTQAALRRVERAAESVGTGLDTPSFREGQPDAGRADLALSARVADISERLDPHHAFRLQRDQGVPNG
ncbi:hypothetical protein IV500_14025 [Paeniglutamicibacter antarcticus]|uniref:Uncharacterized protein n=1 Tax=Arthrobacter terrae TaxID=2935737 RepID=A0A931CKZ5_9MICC|nr:hypothetical protein [Arthrobacter terrae]MBG0740497.1 hypothetical protein [Arthrobacter terrae]